MISDALEDALDEASEGGSSWPWWGWMILWLVFIIMVLPTSCVVVTSLDDVEQTAAEAEAIKAKTELHRVEVEGEIAMEKERLATLERLVQGGMGPVAARCAVEGWSSADRDACQAANTIEAARQRE